jgi:DNA-binding winged helix-turn-helix (wHTH) protein
VCASTKPRGRDLHHRPVYLSAKLKLLLNPKGNKVRLTEKETLILRYLYRAGQRPVSREVRL